MADVIGPCTTLPGTFHAFKLVTLCDEHPDRPAVSRVQGETDSFGAELIDMCQECLAHYREQLSDNRNLLEQCDWCKNQSTGLCDRRDFEEGTHGRVYRVCDGCVDKENTRLKDDDEFNWHSDDWDDRDDYSPHDLVEAESEAQAYLERETVVSKLEHIDPLLLANSSDLFNPEYRRGRYA